jgi:hypothetical protein
LLTIGFARILEVSYFNDIIAITLAESSSPQDKASPPQEKATNIEQRVKTFQIQLADYKRKIETKHQTWKAKAKPNKPVYAGHITTSPVTYEPSQQLPELSHSGQSSPQNSPTLMTPPATDPALAGEKNSPGLGSFTIKEIEGSYNENYHVKEYETGKYQEMHGEQGIVNHVVMV